jgi:hypothetical protein
MDNDFKKQNNFQEQAKIQMEAFAIKTKSPKYYLANELKRLLEIIENAHSPEFFKDPKEQQKQIDFAHERLFIFCKAFVIGLEANRDD